MPKIKRSKHPKLLRTARVAVSISLQGAGIAVGAHVDPSGLGASVGQLAVSGLDNLLAIIWPISEERAKDFSIAVSEGLAQLQQTRSDVDLQFPRTRELLTTALHLALPMALRTTRAEKLIALRNAVLNSALQTAPGEDLVTTYLSHVDSLSAAHLQVLDYLHDPVAFAKRADRDNLAAQEQEELGRFTTFKELFDNFGIDQSFRDAIVAELESRGFFVGMVGGDPFPLPGPTWPLLTSFAEQFLAFIKDPIIPV